METITETDRGPLATVGLNGDPHEGRSADYYYEISNASYKNKCSMDEPRNFLQYVIRLNVYLDFSNDITMPTGNPRQSAYIRDLRNLVDRKCRASNRSLLHALGLDDVGDGVFYVTLSVSPDKRHRISEEYVTRSAERLVRWDTISIEELFCYKRHSLRHITSSRDILLGGAGMGKTTVLHKFCHSWAKSEPWTNTYK